MTSSLMDNLKDIGVESLTIGHLFNDGKLFEEYLDLIDYERDFTDETVRNMYRLLTTCYIGYGDINSTTVSIIMSNSTEELQQWFAGIGGIAAFERLGNVASKAGEFEQTYKKLKTFSTLRALSKLRLEDRLDEFLKHDAEWALKAYDLAINQIGMGLAKVEAPEILSKNMRGYIEKLSEEGDMGMPIPHKMLDSMLRGFRKGTLNCVAFPTNAGKTRFLMHLLTHLSVENKYRSTLISTEMSRQEMQTQMCVCTANNLFHDTYNDYIEESLLAKGGLTENQRAMLKDTLDYLETNCKLAFICCNVYSFDALKRMIKAEKLRGTDLVVIDVFKPYRDASVTFKDQQEWSAFAKSAELLKNLAIELELCIVVSMQVTPEAIKSGAMEFESIALSKHVAFVMDTVIMGREVRFSEQTKLGYIVDDPTNPFHGNISSLDMSTTNFILKVLKNRAGEAGKSMIYTFDRGKILVEEKGLMAPMKQPSA